MKKTIVYHCRNCGVEWTDEPEPTSERIFRWGRGSVEVHNPFSIPWLSPFLTREAKPRCKRCGSTAVKRTVFRRKAELIRRANGTIAFLRDKINRR